MNGWSGMQLIERGILVIAALDPDRPVGHEGPLVVVITGTAGVGKTSFALRWAHSLREQHPDGQLYMNPRGAPDPHLAVTQPEVAKTSPATSGYAAAHHPAAVLNAGGGGAGSGSPVPA